MVDYTKASGAVVDAQGRRQFVDRNDALGIQGTYLNADDLNQNRNSLVDAVTAAGITPDGADETQVTQAMQYFGKKAASGMVSGSPGVLAEGDVAGAILYYSGAGKGPAFIYGGTTVLLLTSSDLSSYATQDWANGLFATLTQLADEIARAKEAEATKANLDGGNTFTGQQVFGGNVVTAGTAHFEAYDQKGGQASTVFGAYDPGTGNDNVEAFFNIINSARTQVQQFMLMGSGRIASSSLGNVAFESQLPQTGFVTGGIYSIVKGDTSGVSVMSLSFVATITTRNQFVPFPMAFSSAPIINVNNGGSASSQGGVQIRAYGATALGVYIDIADTLGGVHITARGSV
ncbi:hypothetical protein PY793_04260 [Acetobacter fabarum]|uniref:hypothetical protein n=1 Tax=Acetobacter fabarum TaxID=483199 RepID=UPI00312B2AEB